MQKGFSRSFFYVNALLRGMVYDDKAQAHTYTRTHAHPDTHTHTGAGTVPGTQHVRRKVISGKTK